MDTTLANRVTAEVMERLEDRLDKREGRSFKLITVIGALLAFVGYSGVRGLIDDAAGKATAAALKEQRVELELPYVLATAHVAAFELQQSGDLSEPARVALMGAFERMAALQRPEAELVQRRQFLELLESAIDLLAAAGRLSHVDRLFDLFPNACLQSEGIVKSLVRHYGRQAAVGLHERRAAARERFGRVERAAASNGVSQLALVHRLLIEHQDGSAEASRVVLAYRGLDGSGRDYADGYLRSYLTGNWSGSGTSDLRLPLAALAHDLKRRYQLDF